MLRRTAFFRSFASNVSNSTSKTSNQSVGRPTMRTADQIAALNVEPHKRGLKDADRIFTNLYGQHEMSLQGAMKRVCFPLSRLFFQSAFSLCFGITTHFPLSMLENYLKANEKNIFHIVSTLTSICF